MLLMSLPNSDDDYGVVSNDVNPFVYVVAFSNDEQEVSSVKLLLKFLNLMLFRGSNDTRS
jgi:hypothetical protein